MQECAARKSGEEDWGAVEEVNLTNPRRADDAEDAEERSPRIPRTRWPESSGAGACFPSAIVTTHLPTGPRTLRNHRNLCLRREHPLHQLLHPLPPLQLLIPFASFFVERFRFGTFPRFHSREHHFPRGINVYCCRLDLLLVEQPLDGETEGQTLS